MIKLLSTFEYLPSAFAGVVTIEGRSRPCRGGSGSLCGTPATSAGAGVERLFESLLSESFGG